MGIIYTTFLWDTSLGFSLGFLVLRRRAGTFFCLCFFCVGADYFLRTRMRTDACGDRLDQCLRGPGAGGRGHDRPLEGLAEVRGRAQGAGHRARHTVTGMTAEG